MEQIKELLAQVGEQFRKLARGNAVVARPISVGDRHVVPLCELSVSFAGGGGVGEADGGSGEGKPGKGVGGGTGGAAKACPVAVLVVQDGKVKVQGLDH